MNSHKGKSDGGSEGEQFSRSSFSICSKKRKISTEIFILGCSEHLLSLRFTKLTNIHGIIHQKIQFSRAFNFLGINHQKLESNLKFLLYVIIFFHLVAFASTGELLVEVAKLTAPDGESDDHFGWAVDTTDDFLVVGSQDDQPSGSVYVFFRDPAKGCEWTFLKKIPAPQGSRNSKFGSSLSIFGNLLLVGAYSDGVNSGSAYLYDRNQGGENNWGLIKKITASDGFRGDLFGYSLDLSEHTIIVGAFTHDACPNMNDISCDSGSAYIFERDFGGINNWGEIKKITASDASSRDYFGFSVALDADIAIIGTNSDDSCANTNNIDCESGSAYIFSRNHGGTNNWGEVKKLKASDSNNLDFFGYSVSISGNSALVGAHGAGAVYVFERNLGGQNNWGESIEISPLGIGGYDEFGRSVSIDGNRTIIGSSFGNEVGFRSGVAYFFERSMADSHNWTVVSKLVGSETEGYDRFGFSVSIQGETAVIGTFSEDDLGSNSGAAYVFEVNSAIHQNHFEQTSLVSEDIQQNDYFGWSLDLDGNTLIAGSMFEDQNGSKSGSAYIFERQEDGTWQQIKKLLAPDGGPDDFFGYAVSISNDTAVVGATGDDERWESTGSAYIFERDWGGPNNWGFVRKITPSNPSSGAKFGHSLKIDSDTVVLGAPEDSTTGNQVGTAYVFERHHGGFDNWGEVAQVTSSELGAGDWFGRSVGIYEDLVLVGCPRDDEGSWNSGAVYLFERNEGGTNTWGQVGKILPSDPLPDGRFGEDLDLDNHYLIVGAEWDNTSGTKAGAAYIFKRDGLSDWIEVEKLLAPNGSAGDLFGSSVSIENNVVFIGAPGKATTGDSSGSSYIFQKEGDGLGSWGEGCEIIPEGIKSGDYFGIGVVVSGNSFAAGAYRADDHHADAGIVYVFE